MTNNDATPARGDEYYTADEHDALSLAVQRVLRRHDADNLGALVTEDDGLTCAHVVMLAAIIKNALDSVSRPACSGCGERFAEGDEIRAHIATCEKHPMAALTAERDALAQRVAALEADAKRLDWIEAEAARRGSGRLNSVQLSPAYETLPAECEVNRYRQFAPDDDIATFEGASIRDAIDAALRATPTPEAT